MVVVLLHAWIEATPHLPPHAALLTALAKLELEERLRSEGEYRDSIAAITSELEAANKELETQKSHKEGLRSMLDKEKHLHLASKAGSEKNLKKVSDDANARATSRIFKMQVSQKKALKNLKDMESKYKRARAQSDDKDNTITELEVRGGEERPA